MNDSLWLWLCFGIPVLLMLLEAWRARRSQAPVFLWKKAGLTGIHDVEGFNRGVCRCCLVFAALFAVSALPAYFGSNPLMALLAVLGVVLAFLYVYYDYSGLLQRHGKYAGQEKPGRKKKKKSAGKRG